MADRDDLVIGNTGHLGRLVVDEVPLFIPQQEDPVATVRIVNWEDVPIEELADDG